MAQVEIYTTRFCGFCHSAKALLARKGIKFLEIDVSGDPEGRMLEAKESNNCTSIRIRLGNMASGSPSASILGPGPACSALR